VNEGNSEIDELYDEMAGNVLRDIELGSLKRKFFMLTETFAACLEQARPTILGGYYKIPAKQFELMVEQISNAREEIANH